MAIVAFIVVIICVKGKSRGSETFHYYSFLFSLLQVC